jgi:TolB-like protein
LLTSCFFSCINAVPDRRSGTTGMPLVFGDYTLDIDRRELSRGDERVALAPQVFDLLVYLVRNRDRVVSKDDLIEAVWGGRIVSESAVTTRLNAVRNAIGDSGAEQRLIRTVSRRGVRFVGGVREESGPLGATALTSRPAGTAALTREKTAVSVPLTLPDKPSIAVLPFANLGGDPEQEYSADGMVEEIITALSRIRWLFVIARNSSFTYKGQAVDVKQVGRELGVRYVLKGSVRKAGRHVRIAAQLIDTQSGAHLWADRFDGSLEDVFDLQDQVAISVAGAIEPTLQAAETCRSAQRPTSDLTAYDLYLRAYAIVLSSAKQIPEALRLLEQAIERDPHYGPALAWAAVCCERLIVDGQSEDPKRDREKGIDFARRGLQVAGDDAAVLANAAYALAYFGEDVGAMMALIDRALALNPNYARGWHIKGILSLFAGDPEAAIEHVETSLRLSPRARTGLASYIIGAAHFISGHFEAALPKLVLMIQEDPSFPHAYRYLAACYAHLGRLDEAREIVKRLNAINPVVVPTITYYRNPEHRELFLSGLRLAAGEAM